MCEPPETKLVGLFKGFLFVLRVFRLTLFGSLVPFLHWQPNQFRDVSLFYWRPMEERNRKRKDFYKVIKFNTELFKCCCFWRSVLVRKWDIPREKRKVPLGSLNRQKPPPSPARNSEPLDPMNSCNIISQLVDAKAKDILLMVREDQLLKWFHVGVVFMVLQ